LKAPRTVLYTVRATFRAPLPYVLQWCTDYSPQDSGLEGEHFRRQILERTRSRVVYEDLDQTADGWMWSRWIVTIQPPDGWHGDAVGNYRTWSIDYRLKGLSGDRTQLTLRGRRTPNLLGTKNPPKAELERGLTKTWAKFARALEADYKKSVRKKSGQRRSRSPR
jgi:hypothetical protein